MDHNKPTNPRAIHDQQIYQIYDHHKFDPQTGHSKAGPSYYKECESCATIIAEKVLDNKHNQQFFVLLELLMGPIVIDIGYESIDDDFEPEEHHHDHRTLNDLKAFFKLDTKKLKQETDELQKIKKNIDGVSNKGLLSKDLKFIWSADPEHKIKVAVARLLISIEVSNSDFFY